MQPDERNGDPVNWSTLKHIRQSPKHYRHALTTPRTDSDALLLGRLAHCAVYEPDEVGRRYIVEPKLHRGMKDATAVAKGYQGGRETAEQFDASVGCSSIEVVKPDIWERAMGCRDAVLADPIAGPMVKGGYSEQRIEWIDGPTGIACRGRVDHVNGRLSDLKTAQSVDPRLFAANAAKFGYHGQMAWYQNGLNECGIQTDRWPAFITVESSAPFDVVVYVVGPDPLASGMQLWRSCLDTLAECRKTDRWPGLAGGELRDFELPAWAMPEPEAITMGGEKIF